jgi:hypothetical protein
MLRHACARASTRIQMTTLRGFELSRVRLRGLPASRCANTDVEPRRVSSYRRQLRPMAVWHPLAERTACEQSTSTPRDVTATWDRHPPRSWTLKLRVVTSAASAHNASRCGFGAVRDPETYRQPYDVSAVSCCDCESTRNVLIC